MYTRALFRDIKNIPQNRYSYEKKCIFDGDYRHVEKLMIDNKRVVYWYYRPSKKSEDMRYSFNKKKYDFTWVKPYRNYATHGFFKDNNK